MSDDLTPAGEAAVRLAVQRADLVGRLREAEAALSRVRALHEPVHWHIGGRAELDRLIRGESCAEFGDCWQAHCRLCGSAAQWPCQTRAALDGTP